jgi:1-acyl-sn-glycerol-3-phosphate acyltransferase
MSKSTNVIPPLSQELSGHILPTLRMAAIVIIASCMMMVSLVLRLFMLPFSTHWFVRYNTRWIVYPASIVLMRVIGVRMQVIGRINPAQQLVVCHHQGVIDSLMLMALSPCMVISNTDIRGVRGVGWVMEQLGFVFVNRSRQRSIQEVLEPTINMVGKSKINVGFFPEGKSNNGSEMLPFHSSFFQIATAPGAGITPLTFQYTKANGRAVSKTDLDIFVYTPSKGSVVSYVYNMLRVRRTQLEVHVLETIGNGQIQKEAMNRKDICLLSEKRIRAKFEMRHAAE